MIIKEYEELLEKVKDIPTTRAVVELHKPEKLENYNLNRPYGLYCIECDRDGIMTFYPCPTIQAIEKELM